MSLLVNLTNVRSDYNVFVSQSNSSWCQQGGPDVIIVGPIRRGKWERN